jgi:hypothetical protein
MYEIALKEKGNLPSNILQVKQVDTSMFKECVFVEYMLCPMDIPLSNICYIKEVASKDSHAKPTKPNTTETSGMYGRK